MCLLVLLFIKHCNSQGQGIPYIVLQPCIFVLLFLFLEVSNCIFYFTFLLAGTFIFISVIEGFFCFVYFKKLFIILVIDFCLFFKFSKFSFFYVL